MGEFKFLDRYWNYLGFLSRYLVYGDREKLSENKQPLSTVLWNIAPNDDCQKLCPNGGYLSKEREKKNVTPKVDSFLAQDSSWRGPIRYGPPTVSRNSLHSCRKNKFRPWFPITLLLLRINMGLEIRIMFRKCKKVPLMSTWTKIWKKNQVFQTKTCLDGGPLDMVLLEFLEIHCTPAEKINFGLDSPSQSVKVVKLSEFEKYISCFVTVEPPWRIFFTFMKMLPNVSLKCFCHYQ